MGITTGSDADATQWVVVEDDPNSMDDAENILLVAIEELEVLNNKQIPVKFQKFLGSGFDVKPKVMEFLNRNKEIRGQTIIFALDLNLTRGGKQGVKEPNGQDIARDIAIFLQENEDFALNNTLAVIAFTANAYDTTFFRTLKTRTSSILGVERKIWDGIIEKGDPDVVCLEFQKLIVAYSPQELKLPEEA